MLMETSKSWMSWACFLRTSIVISVVRFSKPILSISCARSSESEVRRGGAMDIERRVGSPLVLFGVGGFSKPILSISGARSSESEVRRGGAMDIERRVGSTIVLFVIGEEAVELGADSPMEGEGER